MLPKNNNNWLIAFAAAALFSIAYFSLASYQSMRSEQNERKHIVDMSNAFTTTYTEMRTPDSEVPATFRRQGIEHFTNQMKKSNDLHATTRVRMPGTPGLELHTVEAEPYLRDIIREFAIQRKPTTLVDHRFDKGRLIGRTLIPSIASSESCVACHNKALGADIYQVGDVMGAYIVESDLTPYVQRTAANALIVFAMTFGGAMLFARRERFRMTATVNALENQVTAERERREAEAFANYLASHDALTGLATRKLYLERLNRDVQMALAMPGHADQLVVALIDVDDFKRINDKFGHDAGDALLTEVAQRINRLAERHSGLAARLGGDEFAAVLSVPHTASAVSDLGQRLIDAICQPLEYNQSDIVPSVSIGLASVVDVDAPDPSRVMKAADMALYTAKWKGKRGYYVFDTSLQQTMGRRAAMSDALPLAIERGDVRCVLQPQVNLISGEIVGFETLARWCWDGEEISPAEFIPLAEDTGIVQELDMSVLRQASRHVAQMIATFGQPLRLSSNISTIDFRIEDVAEDIFDILWASGLHPKNVTLEITESAILDDWEGACSCLNDLKRHDIQIALDDFGTGYSSLSYLTKFSFDTIKVDRSFVEALDEDQDKCVLLAHIINLAESLGKSVIVEGIETQKQIDLLRSLGATVGQGFYFAKGLEPSQAWSLLAEQVGPKRVAL